MVETLHDIFHSRSRISKELSDVKGHLQIALDSMAHGLSMYDSDQRLVLCNQKFRELYDLPRPLTTPGATLERIVRTCYRRFASSNEERTASQHVAWIRRQVAMLEEGERQSRTQKLRDGRMLRITIQPLAGGGWLDFHEDVTEEKHREANLLQLAVCDELTKLANRRKFMEWTNKATEDLDVMGFSIHVVEISNFYTMLGAIGLAARDQCMKEVGRHLSELAREEDLPARIDGDLFAVIRRNAEDEKDAMDFNLQIRTTLARPIRVMGHRADLGVRVANVMAPRDGREADQLLDAALTLLHG